MQRGFLALVIFILFICVSLKLYLQSTQEEERAKQCVPRIQNFEAKNNHVDNMCSIQVGRKMNEDGSFRRFEGITVISFLDRKKDVEMLSNMMKYLESKIFKNYYTFLPLDSYHVTIFDVMYDERAPNEGFSDYHNYVTQKEQHLCSIINLLKAKEDATFELRIRYLRRSNLVLVLEAVDSDTNTTIYNYRNTFGVLLNNTRYKVKDEPLHLAFGYLYIEPTVEQQVELSQEIDKFDKISKGLTFRIKSPKLVQFNDMIKFNMIDFCDDLGPLKDE